MSRKTLYIVICHPSDSFSGLGIKAFLSTCRPWEAEDRLQQSVASFAAGQGLKEISWWEALSDIDDEIWAGYGFTPLPLDGKSPFNADGAVTIEVYEENLIASQTEERG